MSGDPATVRSRRRRIVPAVIVLLVLIPVAGVFLRFVLAEGGRQVWRETERERWAVPGLNLSKATFEHRLTGDRQSRVYLDALEIYRSESSQCVDHGVTKNPDGSTDIELVMADGSRWTVRLPVPE